MRTLPLPIGTRYSTVEHYRREEPPRYLVIGRIGLKRVVAVPDTGAELNFISDKIASSLGKSPQPNTYGIIRLPSGKSVFSPGMIRVPFAFAEEKGATDINCLIMPGCSYDLILSGQFLRITETLTKFKRRIRRIISDAAKTLRLNLIGGGRQRLRGYMNGLPTLALPDTGSDVMLVDASYAKSRGFAIDRSPEHWLELQLADGSTVITSGIVQEQMEWRFGDTQDRVAKDFYVLENLPADIIFSNDFLFEMDVYSRYEECLIDLESVDDAAELNYLRLIGKFSPELRGIEDLFINDPHFESRPRPTAAMRSRPASTILIHQYKKMQGGLKLSDRRSGKRSVNSIEKTK
ncbi:hypothetical protein CkaCkLH20_06662 [Colletotrichum karsti]|uniref:Uncharacterized protein n=1 Tax=Colletotrichum karsti TaxID=1095194 RepID=A0A9P6LK72_9PEZI|nr:uncharacterized protein CkaCkLH20_06662 [Colletotrichum karsti]KAF9875730.1 hypothetical protein CkaCkLH20_06662 [Colletotrichum karsti]